MTSLREIELRLGGEAVEGARHEEEGKRKVGTKNGATGRSDIEGKAVRVTASDIGG
jgi:hypothetical protein